MLKPFDKVVMDVSIGSGPYKLGPVVSGKDVTYVRDANYWARDLSVRKGTANFDRILVKIYKDNMAHLEAGEFDLMRIFSAGDWARRVNGRKFDSGELVKAEFRHRYGYQESGGGCADCPHGFGTNQSGIVADLPGIGSRHCP